MVKLDRCTWREPVAIGRYDIDFPDTVSYIEMQSVVSDEHLIPLSEVSKAIQQVRKNYLNSIKKEVEKVLGRNLNPSFANEIMDVFRAEEMKNKESIS